MSMWMILREFPVTRGYINILPGTGRGIMRSMVEGWAAYAARRGTPPPPRRCARRGPPPRTGEDMIGAPA